MSLSHSNNSEPLDTLLVNTVHKRRFWLDRTTWLASSHWSIRYLSYPGSSSPRHKYLVLRLRKPRGDWLTVYALCILMRWYHSQHWDKTIFIHSSQGTVSQEVYISYFQIFAGIFETTVFEGTETDMVQERISLGTQPSINNENICIYNNKKLIQIFIFY